MNVVIYSRVSSQSARQSTERQVVDLERFAAGRGYEVTAVFEEKISGRKANIERPVLSRCLEYCTDPQNRGGYVVADRDLTPGAFNPGDPKVTRYAAHA